jgi:uncharacterized repeat protein (TIGR03803 family)
MLGNVVRALALAVVSVWLLIGAGLAHAQSEAVLYNFCSQPNCSDGGDPVAGLISDGAGNFYGTTPAGGVGSGTLAGNVYELSPDGNGGWSETVLYTFTGGTDGDSPSGPVIFDGAGNLYGATVDGGPNGLGVVFELTPMGGNWTETVLYSAAKHDAGVNPQTGLIMDASGNFYGATLHSVFELSYSDGVWSARNIYSVGVVDSIAGGLTIDVSGNIFGNSEWKVFELTPNGTGGWRTKVLHKFAGYPIDGAFAQGTPVVDSYGNVFGTTNGGGNTGQGTVYEVTAKRKGKRNYQMLYSFQGGDDGALPTSGVAIDSAGNLYGTTSGGGFEGAGTLYELTPIGGGTYQEQIIWRFDRMDGADPLDTPVLDTAGNLYGTTWAGGANEYGCAGSGCGVVFEVTP